MTPPGCPVLPAHRRPAHEILLNDLVLAPDGRTGSVIGFYRSDDETVLVLFAGGDSRQFPPGQLAKVC